MTKNVLVISVATCLPIALMVFGSGKNIVGLLTLFVLSWLAFVACEITTMVRMSSAAGTPRAQLALPVTLEILKALVMPFVWFGTTLNL